MIIVVVNWRPRNATSFASWSLTTLLSVELTKTYLLKLLMWMIHIRVWIRSWTRSYLCACQGKSVHESHTQLIVTQANEYVDDATSHAHTVRAQFCACGSEDDTRNFIEDRVHYEGARHTLMQGCELVNASHTQRFRCVHFLGFNPFPLLLQCSRLYFFKPMRIIHWPRHRLNQCFPIKSIACDQ